MSGFLKNWAAKINIYPSLLSSCSIFRSLFTLQSFYFYHVHFMLVRLILRNELANIVFCNVQKVQKMDVKVPQCPDVWFC